MKAERLLDEIRARLDIVDVISDCMELRRSGQNYKGLCPFHSEKTPSFMVSPDKQIFHCFGCGTGGNMVSFTMRYENLNFHEALEMLAKKAGIDLKAYRFESSNDDIKDKLLDIHKKVLEVFRENLRKTKDASSYLTGRGLTEETPNVFSLGYSLKDWSQITNYLKGRGFQNPVVLQSGIVSAGTKSNYDVFRDRIIFPIFNLQSEVVAFGGRVMDNSEPKYLNSPDTILFKKGETLYGLSHAKDGIRKEGHAVVVEGYFDVLICHQNGINNTVAPLGTALTPSHLRKIKRFTNKVFLVFDGDYAGRSAARRSLGMLIEQGFSTKILVLPEKEDPDSFIRKKGAAAFKGLLAGSGSAVDFVLNSSEKDRTGAVHEAVEFISRASDLLMKEELIRELSEKTGFRENVIREELKKLGRKPGEKTGRPAAPTVSVPPLIYDEEILLLSASIAFPDKVPYILKIACLHEFRNPVVRRIMEKLSAISAGETMDSLMPRLESEEEMLVARLTLHPGFDVEIADKNIDDCLRKVSLRKFDERRRELGMSGDPELLNTLLLEKRKMLKEAR